MRALDSFRQAIERQHQYLRESVPPDREAALLVLIRDGDRLSASAGDSSFDLVAGGRLADPGGSKALQLCLEASGGSNTTPTGSLGAWAHEFREACGRLAEAELVLGHCESGFMRILDDGNGRFDAWIAIRREPATWRERADIDWWVASLSGRRDQALQAISRNSQDVAVYRRIAALYLDAMVWQLMYPPDTVLGGCPVQVYRDVVGWLIGRSLLARDRGEAIAPQPERLLVNALATDLALDPDVAGRAVSALILERENAAWHAAVPGVAAAPLIRVGQDRIAWSLRGLTTEPFLFLTHELRRRDAQDYHNSAYLRERVFRQDLYGLFADKRFVTSASRIELRRAERDLRTDIDAAVFDRKTGTLGLFELKSHDPFAHSAAALARQRDNVLYANRQVSGTLDWLKRHGADEILNRVDRRTAKMFRVQKVYPFVLGRYLVHFNDGPEPDRRAAWSTWPQLLRLLNGHPTVSLGGNPIASLFTRLTNEPARARPSLDLPAREIPLGDVRLVVHPTYADMQASTPEMRAQRM
jgi:hypothetical protein